MSLAFHDRITFDSLDRSEYSCLQAPDDRGLHYGKVESWVKQKKQYRIILNNGQEIFSPILGSTDVHIVGDEECDVADATDPNGKENQNPGDQVYLLKNVNFHPFSHIRYECRLWCKDFERGRAAASSSGGGGGGGGGGAASGNGVAPRRIFRLRRGALWRGT